mmetsp:Transcript_20398/g.40121  ORF Transcript_20398/g.40121 Transcript_20398/m.40121 type:complete len:99 (-) Transcript_20398:1563-1859(-)
MTNLLSLRRTLFYNLAFAGKRLRFRALKSCICIHSRNGSSDCGGQLCFVSLLGGYNADNAAIWQNLDGWFLKCDGLTGISSGSWKNHGDPGISGFLTA